TPRSQSGRRWSALLVLSSSEQAVALRSRSPLMVPKRRLPVDPTRSFRLSFCWETLVDIDSIPNGNGCSAAAETRTERNFPSPRIPISRRALPQDVPLEDSVPRSSPTAIDAQESHVRRARGPVDDHHGATEINVGDHRAYVIRVSGRHLPAR